MSILVFPRALCTSMCCMTSRLMALRGANLSRSWENLCGDTGYMALVRVSSDWRICSWKIPTIFLETGLRLLASVEE